MERSSIAPRVDAAPAKKRNPLRARLYAWHRFIGLLTVIPVIFWTLSGLMHPFMAHWFKPTIARAFLAPEPLDGASLALPVQEVLTQHGIGVVHYFRTVKFDGQTYYQVQAPESPVRYFDTVSGEELENGEKRYAEWLARYFLDDPSSPVLAISEQTQFDGQYKFINRLLPVWRVDFDRPDRMTVYVETTSDRLGTFNPLSRKAFLWVFDNFHNWSFLENISNNTVRITVMLVLLGIVMLSSISGLVIYGGMWKKFKQPQPTTQKGVLRKYHRQIGIAVAFVTLTFAFSGAYHATRKFKPNTLPERVYQPAIAVADLQWDVRQALDTGKVLNFSVVQWQGKSYFQVYRPMGKAFRSDYLDAANGQLLPNGNQQYAQFLATHFAQMEGVTTAAISKTEELWAFGREYGFVFKRLPVVQFQYDNPQQPAVYIETSSSRLAAVIERPDRMEGLSFAVFHKYFLLDWAGSNVRDLAMMLAALGVLTVSLFGLAVFLKK